MIAPIEEEKKALEPPKVEEKKEEVPKPPKAIKWDEKPKNWKATIDYYDSTQKLIESQTIPSELIPGETKIIDWIRPHIAKKINKFGWEKFACWAGHEPIFEDVEFDDINYQRKSLTDDAIKFDLQDCEPVEDWNCRECNVLYCEEEKCVACLKKAPNRIMACLHISLCEECFEKSDRCPMCIKHKI